MLDAQEREEFVALLQDVVAEHLPRTMTAADREEFIVDLLAVMEDNGLTEPQEDENSPGADE